MFILFISNTASLEILEYKFKVFVFYIVAFTFKKWPVKLENNCFELAKSFFYKSVPKYFFKS